MLGKVVYKPVGALVGALGGVIAGWAFKRVWALAGGEDEAPSATDEGRSWREVLMAAMLQGAVFAMVRAALDRSGAVAWARVTGRWPTGAHG
ncbi:DUF4235 domain-containing protein [Kitasatospora sp. NPDC054939]